MRHHRSIIPWVTSVLLVGLAGCAGDSPKSSSDTVAPSAVVQAEEGKDQQASGEVQERAVIRDHRTQPGPFTPSQTIPPPLGKAAPQPLIQGVVANPPAFGSLPGE
ncbi:MAG: hypothetical protein KGJ48_17955, partial [Nitrospirota bacterium]|nr:hypothetical protein [Nitrospirota bacterium]